MKQHKHKRICVFWDNHGIHVGKRVEAFFKNNYRIAMVCNIPYVPEMNGIETMWAKCKNMFRREIS